MSLGKVHQRLFAGGIVNAHSAEADVEALARCLQHEAMQTVWQNEAVVVPWEVVCARQAQLWQETVQRRCGVATEPACSHGFMVRAAAENAPDIGWRCTFHCRKELCPKQSLPATPGWQPQTTSRRRTGSRSGGPVVVAGVAGACECSATSTCSTRKCPCFGSNVACTPRCTHNKRKCKRVPVAASAGVSAGAGAVPVAEEEKVTEEEARVGQNGGAGRCTCSARATCASRACPCFAADVECTALCARHTADKQCTRMPTLHTVAMTATVAAGGGDVSAGEGALMQHASAEVRRSQRQALNPARFRRTRWEEQDDSDGEGVEEDEGEEAEEDDEKRLWAYGEDSEYDGDDE